MPKIGLGGGCHWCTEGVFQSLKGVQNVRQGWISSAIPNESLSEGILLEYDDQIISLKTLIEIHLLTHSSTSTHSMREKYRSAVYVFSSEQEQEVRSIIRELQSSFEEPIITQTLPYVGFKLNDESLLNYFKTRPDAPFCKNQIEPKLQKLLKTHKTHLKDIETAKT